MPHLKRLGVAFFDLIYSAAPLHVAAQCCDSGRICSCQNDLRVERSYRNGRWYVLETANFQVCCDESTTQAENLARHAESLRNVLRAKWLGDAPSEGWNPRCQIVLHSNQRSYVAAVGRGSERTVGSSLVRIEEDRVYRRRIDLVGGQTDFLTAALPHELTHVILRERFLNTKLPRWADEGLATLADTKAKQSRHFKDLQQAIAVRTTFHVASLLAMDEYPRSNRFGAFYGQSASLVEFLVSLKTPETFIEFIERAGSEGYDKALRQCYGISGLGDLDRQWRQHAHSMQTRSSESG
jgi:hypothetical protein